ncbi:hypothetical protein ACS0TY_030280 [Phlomoides rotata]
MMNCLLWIIYGSRSSRELCHASNTRLGVRSAAFPDLQGFLQLSPTPAEVPPL